MASKPIVPPTKKMESKVPDSSPDKMAINYIMNAIDTAPVPSKPPLIQKILHRDVLFMIFDAIVDSNNTIILSPNSKNPSYNHIDDKLHPIIGPLSQTSQKFRAEIIKWSKTRQDLTRSDTFGLLNPVSTSFDFVWIAPDKLESDYFSSKIQRTYHPIAAVKHFQRLELWQRGLWKIARLADPWKRRAHAMALGLATSTDFEWHNLHPEFQEKYGRRSVRPELNEHLEDGVREVLVMDWKRYGDKLFPKAFVMDEYNLQLGWEDGKQAFVWSNEWEKFEENRKIVSDDKVSTVNLASNF